MSKDINILETIFIFGAQYLYIIALIIAFLWFLKQARARQREVLTLMCICLPLIFIASFIAGHLYYNPRPFVLGNFKPLIPHKPNNGFPSHHVLLISAISAVIFLFSRRVSLLLWILTLFVGLSRVYAGVHHIVDVATSVLISVILVSLTYFLYAKHSTLYAKK